MRSVLLAAVREVWCANRKSCGYAAFSGYNEYSERFWLYDGDVHTTRFPVYDNGGPQKKPCAVMSVAYPVKLDLSYYPSVVIRA